jgi:hypothetical protein
VDAERHERLLQEGDPLRDGTPVATRRLGIDEAERIRAVLSDADIPNLLRLIERGDVPGADRDPTLRSEYSVLHPSWNVVVPAHDLARARALVEARLKRDVDGRADTAALAGLEPPMPSPVPLCVLPWDEAWSVVERLARGGVRAAVGALPGEGEIARRDATVLVLPDDVDGARALIPELPPMEDA